MSIEKLTDADYNGKGVTGLADTPGLSTLEMQQKLDELSRSVVGPKVNEVIDALNTAYVVATGTEGIWTYRTWSDDTMECWGTVSAAVAAAATADGGVYCTGQTDFAAQADPAKYGAAPACMPLLNAAGAWLRVAEPGTTEQSPSFQLVRSTAGAAGTADVQLYVIGRLYRPDPV